MAAEVILVDLLKNAIGPVTTLALEALKPPARFRNNLFLIVKEFMEIDRTLQQFDSILDDIFSAKSFDERKEFDGPARRTLQKFAASVGRLELLVEKTEVKLSVFGDFNKVKEMHLIGPFDCSFIEYMLISFDERDYWFPGAGKSSSPKNEQQVKRVLTAIRAVCDDLRSHVASFIAANYKVTE